VEKREDIDGGGCSTEKGGSPARPKRARGLHPQIRVNADRSYGYVGKAAAMVSIMTPKKKEAAHRLPVR